MGENVTQKMFLWTGSSIATAIVIWQLYRLLYRTLSNRKLKYVGRITAITIFPIKSCKGIHIDSAYCSEMGLLKGNVKDRHFILINKQNNKLISGREEPTLYLVTPSLHDDEIWLDAPSMPTLKINIHDPRFQQKDQVHNTRIWDVPVEGVNCGPEACQWFNTYLKRDDVILMTYSSFLRPKFCSEKLIVKHLCQAKDKAAYADFSAYLLMNEASVEDLNTRIKKEVTPKNFRANILMSGSSAYSEDKWKKVRIGDNVWFRNIKLCQRCTAIVIDPVTAERDKTQEALSTLLKYRKAIHIEPSMKKFDGDAALLGLHLTTDTEGEIRVGDSIYALE